MIGFFGGYQQPIGPFSSSGRGFSGTGFRVVGMNYVSWVKVPNANGMFQYLPSNEGIPPTRQNLRGTEGAYNGDERLTFDKGITRTTNDTGAVLYQAIISATRSYIWQPGSSFPPPASRMFNVLLYNPGYIRAISYGSSAAAGAGDYYNGTFRLPYVPNCEVIRLILGSTQVAGVTVPAVTGNWPPNLKTLHLVQGTTLLSVEKKFPSRLKHLHLMANAGLTNTNELIADCAQLESLVLSTEAWTQAGGTGSGFLGAGPLQISHITGLKMFSVGISSLTDIVFANFSSMRRWNLTGSPSLNAATFLSMLNQVLQSPEVEYINGSANNIAFSRTFDSADFGPALKNFWLQGNRITASQFNLTTARPGIAEFMLGDRTDTLVATAKSNLETIDISGLTGARIIDLSNCSARYVVLPVNTTIVDLALGGNRINISGSENAALVNQIRAMTSLVYLSLSISSSTSLRLDGGQDGFSLGVVNLDSLTSLSTVYASGCGLSGVLTLPPSATGAVLLANPALTGVASSSFSNLTGLRVTGCTAFNQDFTLMGRLDTLIGQSTSITQVDFSNRSTAVSIHVIDVANNTKLTIVRMPADPASAVLDLASGYYLSFSNCPLLTSIENLENLSYEILTSGTGRIFRAASCALNIDFKIGVNNFLPTNISIQSNAMDAAHVNLNIDNVYQNRAKWSTTIVNKLLEISGTNAVASGVFQAPAEFVPGVSDGAPATAKEQAYVLVNNYGWTITMN